MINMRTIFREPAARTIKLITEAHSVLEKWEQAYMDTRKQIEESGRDNRWEFDRVKLFMRTHYMATRCTDLLFVAEMLRDMRAMLGPELKAVTGDAKGIDEVMSRVDALVGPLESAPFDLFDRRYQASWEVSNHASCCKAKSGSQAHSPSSGGDGKVSRERRSNRGDAEEIHGRLLHEASLG